MQSSKVSTESKALQTSQEYSQETKEFDYEKIGAKKETKW